VNPGIKFVFRKISVVSQEQQTSRGLCSMGWLVTEAQNTTASPSASVNIITVTIILFL
jgi:hypothetical protein